MHCKTLLIFIVSVNLVSLVASSGFSQCSQSNGTGNQCVNPNQTNTGGPYLPHVAPIPNPNPYPLQPPAVEPPVGQGSIDGLVGGNPFRSDESFTVVIGHPSGAADLTVRSFSDRNEAVQLVQQLNQRFWVAYTDSANQRGYREANSAVDITRVVNEIRAQGHDFKGAVPVAARIALQEKTTLENLLGGEPMAPPLPTVQEGIEEPSRKETENSIEESPLAAIEGIWTAVARSSNGELKTIELKLDSGGWASLTIPDALGQAKTIERRAVIEDGQLKLQDGDQEMLLGQIAQVKSNQLVVTRDNGQVTFLKQ